jgi:IS30 family transposase
MKKRYKQLSLEERDRITEMTWAGSSITEIAKELGRAKSTISREVLRNSSPAYKLYLSHRAHERAVLRRKETNTRHRLKNEEIVNYVHCKLKLGWSPEQIAGRIDIEHPHLSISHEAIYQYIYDQKTNHRAELIGYLRRGHKTRKRKGVGRKERRTKIPNRIAIEERPLSVENRSCFGHWEGDSIVSRKSVAALNTLVERKSRLVLITLLQRKTAQETSTAVIEKLGNLPSTARQTLTMDNGTENTRHEDITKAIGTKCYFAKPYASWQRGTNENINGLIRWYLPKGTDFSIITDKEVAHIESLINNRPKKCLGYKTPIEVASSFVALHG